MKTINEMILLLLLVLLTGHVRGQEADMERGKVYPGFIITLDGDTIDGHLLNINLWLNQHMTFMYKDPENAEGRVKYKAGEIKAYQVGIRYYESMDYTFAYSTKTRNFILRKADGPINLYIWYYDEDRGKLLSPDISLAELAKAYLFEEKDLWSNAFGKKKNGEFTELTSVKFLMKFAKNMSAYIADNPELARKVLDKTPGYQGTIGGIEKIIREYNEGKLAN
jgi:hypothetical protein